MDYMDCTKNFIIALDGPAAAGKGTLAKTLALQLKLYYCQTGLFFRKIAYEVIKNNIPLDEIKSIVDVAKFINYEIQDKDALHEEIVGKVAFTIASLSEVRDIFYTLYKHIIQNHKRIILEGRDIATVLAPEAHLKIYLTADVNIRANRRFKQLLQLGKHCTIEDILNNLILRDTKDSLRDLGPLKISKDALVIDTTNFEDENKVFEFVKKYIEQHF